MVNQRDDLPLHKRLGAASPEFSEILIDIVLHNVKLFIYICDFEKEIKSLLLNCSRRLTVDLNSYTGLGREMHCHISPTKNFFTSRHWSSSFEKVNVTYYITSIS